MKILFLSYYFEPDLSAGSFRATALIKELSERLPKNSEVDVITTQPNRYHTFKSDSLAIEKRENISIHRVQLPNHKNGFFDQALTFRHYASYVKKIAKKNRYNMVVATSSRLMTAVLASYIARKQKSKLYLDIRDIFVDTISGVFPLYITAWAVPIFGALEKYAIKKADHVNLVSEGFKTYFDERYPTATFSYYTNGIDDVFMNYQWPTNLEENSERIILYAGNMGDGQGLHLIVPELAQSLGKRYKFRLIGDGGKRSLLVSKINELELDNVEILPPVKRETLLTEYAKAHILFLHLNDVPAFERVLPSKLFEYAATGKPILAGVGGYAAKFVSSQIDNAAVFNPCNVQQAVQRIELLSSEIQVRERFLSKYSRKAISRGLVSSILQPNSSNNGLC
ncbi:Glycosyltransferase involved in cell wall bisynthesis [Pseudidiomarina indica]|uniref:Glycosyltransferase involved in cell wall bisynthesis n=1 Tax=Pseudidiomarina indica TaxID=1159017 RepID=A0A1G6AUD0_9GAMM|nr:glycosyltransferase family 4 protein [Pseudidiomarina indica]SDB12016.1 Glycosyltransferase involved in cell wall bisynthesis [Pseudidiomarina indica]